MAHLIEALRTLGPKLVHGRTIELEELAEWTANRSGLTAEEVERVLKAVRSAPVHDCRGGAAVRLPGIGRIRLTVDRLGRVRTRIVPDPELDRALGSRGANRGEIQNRANLGLSDAELEAALGRGAPGRPAGAAAAAGGVRAGGARGPGRVRRGRSGRWAGDHRPPGLWARDTDQPGMG